MDFETWELRLSRDPFLSELGTSTPDVELDSAVWVAKEGIGELLGRIADRMLGRPGPADEGYLEHLQAQGKMTPEQRAAAELEWHLLKMRIARRLGLDQTGETINARRLGASWQVIADACGISRQAAHDRWAAICAELNEPHRDWEFLRTRDLQHWQVGYRDHDAGRWAVVSEHTSCEAARAEVYARTLCQQRSRNDRRAWLDRFDLDHAELVEVATALGRNDTDGLTSRQLTDLIASTASPRTAVTG